MTSSVGRRRAAAFALAALGVGLAGFAAWRGGWLDELANVDSIAAWMRGAGPAAPLACIGIQVLQVVFFPVPGGVVQFAAGYVFGGWIGFLLSWVGIMLGSAAAFLVGSTAGRAALERWVSTATTERIATVVHSEKAHVGLFVAYLVPGSPKDAFCYASGAAGFGLGEFLVISGLGRAPALLLTTLLGAQLSERDYTAFTWTGLAGLAAAALYWFYRRRVGAA